MLREYMQIILLWQLKNLSYKNKDDLRRNKNERNFLTRTVIKLFKQSFLGENIQDIEENTSFVILLPDNKEYAPDIFRIL